MMKRTHAAIALAFAVAVDAVPVALLYRRATRAEAELADARAARPFTFQVERGACACGFDDDATAWDFAARRERVRQTVCR